jgi:hypothetical protein
MGRGTDPAKRRGRGGGTGAEDGDAGVPRVSVQAVDGGGVSAVRCTRGCATGCCAQVAAEGGRLVSHARSVNPPVHFCTARETGVGSGYV